MKEVSLVNTSVKKMDIGPRIKAERERLGLSQTAFAELLGSTKRSVINWEGEAASPPADAVARMAAIGADALFILLGQRSQPIEPAAALPKDKQALLNSYDMCSAAAKKNLLQTAALLAAGLTTGGAGGRAGSGVNQTISAPVQGSVAGRDVFHNSSPAKPPRKPR